ncbi:MAG: InlB B-repeat-containing protein [Chitinispirillales bacterium]|jgi:uncharacterized protein (TIGR02145 family)/uncharacterized repeat protein (TIGR02543 family)|nr:InlB B-repeat-containing protein [Chitinispirillales bacterium]
MKNLRSSGKHAGGTRAGVVTADVSKIFRNILLTVFMIAAAFMLSCTDREDDSKNPVGPGTPNPGTEWEPVNINAVGRTEDGNEVLVFQKGQLDRFFIRMDTTEITPDGALRAKLYFKDMNLADIPNTGDVIASHATEMAKYGFLYKVLGVSTGTDGVTIVEVRIAALEEAFEDVEYEAEVEIQFDEDGNQIGMLVKTLKASNFLLDIGNAFMGMGNKFFDVMSPVYDWMEDVTEFVVEGNLDINRNISAPLKKDTELSLISNLYMRGEVDFSLKLKVLLDVKKWSLKNAEISLKADGNIGLGSHIRESTTIYFLSDTSGKSGSKTLYEKDIWTITFVVGGVPVIITNDFVVQLYGSIKAEAKMGVMCKLTGMCKFGFEYANGNWKEINENTFRPSIDDTPYLKGEIAFGVSMGLTSKLYGIVGLSATAGPGLVLTARASPTGVYMVEEIPNQEISLDFIVRFFADVKLTLWAKDLGFNGGIGNKIFGEKRDWSFTITNKELYRKPIFKKNLLPTVSRVRTDLTWNSAIVRFDSYLERDLLSYPAKEYGYCIESPNSGECRRGSGIIYEHFDLTPAIVQKWTENTFTAAFDVSSDLPPGTYHVRPYFKNTLGGTYYYNATEVEAKGYMLSGIGYQLTGGNSGTIKKAGGSISYSPRGKPGKQCVWSNDYAFRNVEQYDTEYYIPGTQVTVTATPDEGYVFTGWHWVFSEENTDNQVTTFLMTSNHSVPTPIFKRPFVVTTVVNPVGSGTLLLSPAGSSVLGNPNQARYLITPIEDTIGGTRITATAVPSEGYRFSHWVETENSQNIEYYHGTVRTIPLNNESERTLIAEFQRLYTLTTNVIPAGSGTVSVTTERENYAAGTRLHIAATPAEGYVFTGWQGASTSSNQTLNTFVTADSNQTLTATFARAYTLTINTPPGGSVSYISHANRNQTIFANGTDVTVEARPMPGYAFTGWSGASTSTTPTVTVTMNSDKTLTANFSRMYTLVTKVATPIAGGNVSRSPNQSSYLDGTQVTITAAPSSNYVFVGWSGASMSTAPAVTVTMNSDQLLEAKFARTNISPDKIFTDPRDGQTYITTKIGAQTWMAENLRYDNLRFPKGYWKDHSYDSDEYGMLYFLDDADNVCPAGWHLPKKNEWELLIASVGGYLTGGTRLKAENGWGANGTNDYDFTALPGGIATHVHGRYPSPGVVSNTGYIGYWWSGGDVNDNRYVARIGYYGGNPTWNSIELLKPADVRPAEDVKTILLNVRCVQDPIP